MRVNYMFTVYNEPELLARTVSKLQHPQAYFYIHVDGKKDIEPFLKSLNRLPHVFFLTGDARINVEWGDISMVQAELNLMRAVVSDTKEGYCVLISGQDYPIKSTAYIHDYFAARYPAEFIHAEPLEQTEPVIRRIMNRHARWHWVTVAGKFKIVILPWRFVACSGWRFFDMRCLKKLCSWKMIANCCNLFFTRRKFPADLHLYASETWFEITTRTAERVLRKIEEHPEYMAYYRTFGLPEESMLQSIILSDAEGKRDWAGDFLLYVNRNRSDENGMPVPCDIDLTAADISDVEDKIKNAPDKLFARKVSLNEVALLERIDSLTN